ncbi:MAG: hypothetical protein IIB59_01930 [Planctomycetes bacterium]|nr:hypothetical protein [Planctomycetota bacterium]
MAENKRMCSKNGLSGMMCSAVMVAIAVALISPLKVNAENKEVEPAIGGYCPVSYQFRKMPVKGDAQWQSNYLGDVYYFADKAMKTSFDRNPENFAPQFGGLCTTALGGPYGNRLPPDPTVFALEGGQLFLFSSARAKRAYDLQPFHYIDRARELYDRPQLEGFCAVSYHSLEVPVAGQKKFRHRFRGLTYHFVSAEARATFSKDPQKYLPAYGGFCAEGISRMKRYPADPRVFVVVDGTTYLFFDQDEKTKFQAASAVMIKQADANWERLKKK